jgi:hypothetical protein
VYKAIHGAELRLISINQMRSGKVGLPLVLKKFIVPGITLQVADA